MKLGRKLQITVSLFEIAPFTTWMRDNGIPFLAKFDHQRAWTMSRKAAPFMERFKPEHRKSRTNKNGVEKLIKFQMIVPRRDWALIEMHIRLKWPHTKITLPRKKLPRVK